MPGDPGRESVKRATVVSCQTVIPSSPASAVVCHEQVSWRATRVGALRAITASTSPSANGTGGLTVAREFSGLPAMFQVITRTG